MSEFLAAYGLFLAQLATPRPRARHHRRRHRVVAPPRARGRARRRAPESAVRGLRRRAQARDRGQGALQEGREGAPQGAQARGQSARARRSSTKPRLFVLDFKGDLRASAAASLREEVSAVLRVAKPGEQVLLRLENSGGTVHEHGFAASQLTRLKQHGLTLARRRRQGRRERRLSHGLRRRSADRRAVRDRRLDRRARAAAELPPPARGERRRLRAGHGGPLQTHADGVRQEHGRGAREAASRRSRTSTSCSRAQIREHRPQVDLERVATGEHWYGVRALELKLVDELKTSDDILLEAAKDHDLYHIAYKRRRSWQERMIGGAESLLTR